MIELRLEDIKATHARLSKDVIRTPILDGRELIPALHSPVASLSLKSEIFQRSGSFKFRGALNAITSLSPDELKRGIVAFSGGNHAIAVAYVAKLLGLSAKVVMPSAASPRRVEKCRDLGAEVFLVDQRADVPRIAAKIVEEDGRTLIPPFDHQRTIAATATIGYELLQQQPKLDVVFMAVGGGGLAGGVACAIKQIAPKCRVFGVQPKSADAMYRSLQSGHVEENVSVATFADSLCPPRVGDLTFEFCKRYLDGILLVDEKPIVSAMRLLSKNYQLVAEAAAAVPLAALLAGSIELSPKDHVAIILGGSSIDLDSFRIQTGF